VKSTPSTHFAIRFNAVATFTWSSYGALAATISKTPLAVRCVIKSSPRSLYALVKPRAVRSDVRVEAAARAVTHPGPSAKPVAAVPLVTSSP
jgi:hypothetical protein